MRHGRDETSPGHTGQITTRTNAAITTAYASVCICCNALHRCTHTEWRESKGKISRRFVRIIRMSILLSYLQIRENFRVRRNQEVSDISSATSRVDKMVDICYSTVVMACRDGKLRKVSRKVLNSVKSRLLLILRE